MGRKFKPGESGNPEGRARVKAITDMIRKIAHEEVEVGDGQNTRLINRLRKSTEALFDEADKGNVAAYNVIAERLEGKVKEVVKHEGDAFSALWEAIQGNARVRPDDDSDDDRPTTH